MSAPDSLPPLPEWSLRDDLGGIVPSEIRQGLRAYALAAVLAENARCVAAVNELVSRTDKFPALYPEARLLKDVLDAIRSRTKDTQS